ncbi:MAG: AraC family transcriptional regulator [Clostridiales bacterium]|jgi:hypothetical protein|nr:AraC family transcriptional regulator [Clostridiales bacterium]
MDMLKLAQLIEAKTLTDNLPAQEVTNGYCCDLLSLVMGKACPGMAWVTVQTHLNVVAVAALGGIACIILPEGIRMEGPALDKAQEEGIAVLSSPLTAYEISALMYARGVAPTA